MPRETPDADLTAAAVIDAEVARRIAAFEQQGFSPSVAHSALNDIARHLRETTAWLVENALRASIAAEKAARTILTQLGQAHEPGRPDRSLTYLLRDRPHLLQALGEHLDRRCAALAEFLSRLEQDLPEIIALTPRERGSLGRLRHLALDCSDRHRSGRTVVIAEFEGGERIVYKPRSVEPESAWRSYTTWLEQRGAPDAPRAMRTIKKEGYGWQEFARPEVVGSNDPISFYRACGSLTAYIDLIGGTDLHFENVIASGGIPIVVDLEMVFQPAFPAVFPETGPGAAQAKVHDYLRHSVLATGFIGNRVRASDGRIVEIGASQARPSEPSYALPTDEPRNRAFRFSNLPYAEISLGTSAGARMAFVAGFQKAEQFLADHRTWLADDPRSPIHAFDGVQSRVVFRPTSTYANMIDSLVFRMTEMDQPPAQAVRRNLADFTHWRGASRDACIDGLMVLEERALAQFDVPIFHSRPSERAVYADDGMVCSGFFRHSGDAAVRARIDALGDTHRGQQVAIIDAALSSSGALNPLEAQPDVASEPSNPLELARAIGDLILESSFVEGGGRAWLSMSEDGAHQSTTLKVAGNDLYSGSSGIGLFLAALAATTGEPSHTEACRETFRTIAEDESARHRRGLNNGPGLGSGDAGIFYAAATSAALLDDPFLRATTTSALDALARDYSLDLPPGDLVDGSAGLVLAFVCAHELGYGRTSLDLARHHALRLSAWLLSIDRDRAPVGAISGFGFAHGLTGVLYSLERFNRRAPSGTIADSVAAGTAMVMNAYDATLQNLPDTRYPPTHSRRWTANHWCHGAVGAAMAHYALAGSGAGLFPADHPILRSPARLNFGSDHLCCGSSTWAELNCLMQAVVRDREGPSEMPSLAALRLPYGEPRYNPGLMDGLSGIGYTALRCARPSHIPSAAMFSTLGSRPYG